MSTLLRPWYVVRDFFRHLVTSWATWICVVVTVINAYLILPVGINHFLAAITLVLNIIGYFLAFMSGKRHH